MVIIELIIRWRISSRMTFKRERERARREGDACRATYSNITMNQANIDVIDAIDAACFDGRYLTKAHRPLRSFFFWKRDRKKGRKREGIWSSRFISDLKCSISYDNIAIGFCSGFALRYFDWLITVPSKLISDRLDWWMEIQILSSSGIRLDLEICTIKFDSISLIDWMELIIFPFPAWPIEFLFAWFLEAQWIR